MQRLKSKNVRRAAWPVGLRFVAGMPAPARNAISRYYDELRTYPAYFDDRKERRLCRRFAKSAKLAGAASAFLDHGGNRDKLFDVIDRALHLPAEWLLQPTLTRKQRTDNLLRLAAALARCSSIIISDQRLLYRTNRAAFVVRPGFRGRPVAISSPPEKRDPELERMRERLEQARRHAPASSSIQTRFAVRVPKLPAEERRKLARARRVFSKQTLEPDVPMRAVESKSTAREYADANQFDDLWSDPIRVQLIDPLEEPRSKRRVVSAIARIDLRKLAEIQESIHKAVRSRIDQIHATPRTVESSETNFAIRELVSILSIAGAKSSQQQGTVENRLIEVLVDLTVPRTTNDVERRSAIRRIKTRRGVSRMVR